MRDPRLVYTNLGVGFKKKKRRAGNTLDSLIKFKYKVVLNLIGLEKENVICTSLISMCLTLIGESNILHLGYCT